MIYIYINIEIDQGKDQGNAADILLVENSGRDFVVLRTQELKKESDMKNQPSCRLLFLMLSV